MSALTIPDYRSLANMAAVQLDEAFRDLATAEALDNPDRIALAFRSIAVAAETVARNAHGGQVLAEEVSDRRWDEGNGYAARDPALTASGDFTIANHDDEAGIRPAGVSVSEGAR